MIQMDKYLDDITREEERLRNLEDRVFLISCLNYLNNRDLNHYTMYSIANFCDTIFFAAEDNSYDEKTALKLYTKYRRLEIRIKNI